MGLTSLAGFFGTGGSDYQKYLKSKAQALFVETCLSPNLQYLPFCKLGHLIISFGPLDLESHFKWPLVT